MEETNDILNKIERIELLLKGLKLQVHRLQGIKIQEEAYAVIEEDYQQETTRNKPKKNTSGEEKKTRKKPTRKERIYKDKNKTPIGDGDLVSFGATKATVAGRGVIEGITPSGLFLRIHRTHPEGISEEVQRMQHKVTKIEE